MEFGRHNFYTEDSLNLPLRIALNIMISEVNSEFDRVKSQTKT